MNPQTRALAIEMLKQGKPLGEIGDRTGLLDREVIALAKEVSQQVGITQTPTAQAGSGRATAVRGCDQAGCRAPAAEISGNWAFCATHARARDRVSTEGTAKRTIAELLEDASGHSVARVRTLAARIETDLDKLRGLINEHHQAEAAKQRAAAEKEKARAEIARLEAELAAAKAKLRGKPTPQSLSAEGHPSALACRKDCGKSFVNAAGRGNHEKHCTGAAAA